MMKKVLVLGICVYLFAACSGRDVKRDLPDVVNTINKECPQMLDSETRMDGVQLKGEDTLIYKYTLVHFLAQRIDTTQFYRAMWPGIVSNIRISPEMKKLREAAVVFYYAYRDSIGQNIYSFRVTPTDYQ